MSNYVPAGGETGRQNSQLNFQVQLWNQKYQLGTERWLELAERV